MSGTTTTESHRRRNRRVRIVAQLIAGSVSLCVLGRPSAGANRVKPQPVRSRLHACVVSTVVAVPSRFSICQLRNTDDGRTGLYRVGDRFMGSRIRAIWNGRVLVGDAEHPEYIGPGECGADPSPATYLPVSDDPLPVLDATSPQG